MRQRCQALIFIALVIFRDGFMPQRYENVLEGLQNLLENTMLSKHPGFVVNGEIRSRNLVGSDYTITYSPEWGTDYFRFDYAKAVNWDFGKITELKNMIKEHPRYQVINDRINQHYLDLVTKEYKIGQDKVLDKILIFDIKGYEKEGFDGILRDLDPQNYISGRYYDPYGDQGVEKLAEAENQFHNRLAAAIDRNSMVTSILFLEHGSDLFQKIEERFFEIKK